VTKKVLAATTALYPIPAVMATCGEFDGVNNIITLAWAGTVCSDPPMISIGVRPSRFSYDLIKKTGEFVINLATVKEVQAMDFCGIASGRDGDKFLASGLTPERASKVKAPLIKECPVNIECVVRHIYAAGSHDVFLGEVIAVNIDETRTAGNFLKPEEAIAYHAAGYFTLRDRVGVHGFSKK